MRRDIPALLRYLAEREAMPFGWWANDCVTYARGAVIAQGGPDPLEGVTPWTDEPSARAALEAEGGIVAAVDRRLRSIVPAQAMRGDIGYVPLLDGSFFLAVVDIPRLRGPGARRTRHVDRHLMTRAWSAL